MLTLIETEWAWVTEKDVLHRWRKFGKSKVDYWFRMPDNSKQFIGVMPISHVFKEAKPVAWRCSKTKATICKESIFEYVYKFRKHQGVAKSYPEAVDQLNKLIENT